MLAPRDAGADHPARLSGSEPVHRGALMAYLVRLAHDTLKLHHASLSFGPAKGTYLKFVEGGTVR
jgi:hypothetical protein